MLLDYVMQMEKSLLRQMIMMKIVPHILSDDDPFT